MRIYLLPVKQQEFLILSTDYRTVFSLEVGWRGEVEGESSLWNAAIYRCFGNLAGSEDTEVSDGYLTTQLNKWDYSWSIKRNMNRSLGWKRDVINNKLIARFELCSTCVWQMCHKDFSKPTKMPSPLFIYLEGKKEHFSTPGGNICSVPTCVQWHIIT